MSGSPHLLPLRRFWMLPVLPVVRITGNQNDLPAAAAPIYAGEEAGQEVANDASSEAFDEPLIMDQVLAIANLFIVS